MTNNDQILLELKRICDKSMCLDWALWLKAGNEVIILLKKFGEAK